MLSIYLLTVPQDDLFASAGNESLVDDIREVIHESLILMHISPVLQCLDSGEEFPFSPSTDDPMIVIAFGSALLQLLNSLVEPIVPSTLHSRCAQAASRDEAFEVIACARLLHRNIDISAAS
jgi:hypothetical protein